MKQNKLSASFSKGPIQTLAKLAEVVGVALPELRAVTRRSTFSYRRVTTLKKDGGVRVTWDAFRRLKRIQQRIKSRLLLQVEYPTYLQGGIRDRKNPRDYAKNAAIHAGQACVLNEDIKDFYPSISADQVREIWLRLFRYPREVADVLTQLTTKDGALPQGAKTSSYLANLVFWRTEPQFVRYLLSQGLRYSRLADDITISSSWRMNSAEKRRVKSLVHSFVRCDGFSRNYRKQKIYTGSGRMLVNGLVVNVHPALPIEERHQIRGLVHRWSKDMCPSDVPHVGGKVGKLKRFHPRAAAKLRAILSP